MHVKFFEPKQFLSVDQDDPPDDGGGGSDDLDRRIADAANRALTHRLKRGGLKELVEQTVQNAVTEVLPTVLESVTAKGEKDGETPKNGAPGNIKDHPEYQALLKRQEAQEAKFREMEQKQQEAERRRQEAEERSVVESALGASGVAGKRVAQAFVWMRAQGLIGRDSDGNVVYRAERDGYVDELKLADGVKEFLASDDGKDFLPPKDVAGSGSRSRGKAVSATSKNSGPVTDREGHQLLGEILMGGVPGMGE